MKMNWSKLLSFESFRADEQTSESRFELTRTPFQRDYDRIIFSEEFRRLDKKTQVHPLKINDHVHARMTHSLETSCVGRSLGSLVGTYLAEKEDFLPYPEIIGTKKNSDAVLPIITGQIVQAACLAHDIGNPPFGHAGEELIQDWFKARRDSELFKDISDAEMNDLMEFEGNAQAFRILTRLSMRRDSGGMGMTYGVLGSMMKYPWVYSEKLTKSKYSSFSSEKKYLKKIAGHCGLAESETSESGYSYARHPFAFLSEASDDICYNIMDLEDAYELKILDYDTVYDIFSRICGCGKGFRMPDFGKSRNKSNLSHLRAIAIYQCTEAVAKKFSERYDEIMSGSLEQGFSLLENCENIKDVIKEAKEISRTQVFRSERKALLEIAANKALDTLLTNFCTAVYDEHIGRPSGFSAKITDLMGASAPAESDSLFQKYQKVMDHIAGMTDNYAIRIAKNLNGIVE